MYLFKHCTNKIKFKLKKLDFRKKIITYRVSFLSVAQIYKPSKYYKLLPLLNRLPERTGLLALLWVVFLMVLSLSPCGILGQIWYLIVSILFFFYSSLLSLQPAFHPDHLINKGNNISWMVVRYCSRYLAFLTS